MSTAGQSAGVHGAALRQHARRGVWRPVLSALGVTAHTRVADAQAAKFEAGERGEQLTAALLHPLAGRGWRIWHGLAIPGAHSANADHLVCSPGGVLFLVDSKLWHGRAAVHGADGRLWHGSEARDKAVRSLRFEAELVARAVGVQVWRIVAVHNAPVAGDGFGVQGAAVIPAWRLVHGLVELGGRPDPRAAAAVASRVDARLRPYGAGRGG